MLIKVKWSERSVKLTFLAAILGLCQHEVCLINKQCGVFQCLCRLNLFLSLLVTNISRVVL